MLFFIVLFRPVSRRDGSSRQTTQSLTLKPAYFCDDLHDFKIIAKTVRCLLENMFFFVHSCASFFTLSPSFSCLSSNSSRGLHSHAAALQQRFTSDGSIHIQ